MLWSNIAKYLLLVEYHGRVSKNFRPIQVYQKLQF